MSVQPSFWSSPRKTARRDCTCRSLSAAAINTPIRRILPDGCARPIAGHAAAPPSAVMNSRRFMSDPKNSGDGILAAKVNALIGQKQVSRAFSSREANVADGSKPEMAPHTRHDRSTLKSRHRPATPTCQLRVVRDILLQNTAHYSIIRSALAPRLLSASNRRCIVRFDAEVIDHGHRPRPHRRCHSCVVISRAS
jgi:hypothetical protein